MPVKFLTNEQINSYAAFPESLEDEHLAKYCYLDDTDKRLISDCRRDYNKLGYALQLVTVRLIGRFLPNPVEVPDAIRSFVTIQLHISAPVDLSKYLERKATRLKHCDEIKHTFGYSEFNNHWYFVLARWLYYQAWFGDDRPSILFEKTVNWLISKKILLPGISTLDRLISKIRDRAKKRLWLKLSKTVNDEQTQQLIKLLNIPKGKRYSKLDELKNGPTRISSSGLMYGLSRYQFIREIAVRQSKFSHIPKPKIAQLARYVKTSWAPSVARMSKNHKLAVLVAFAYVYEIKALDDALDLLDMLITEIVAKAVKAGKKKEERTRGDLDKAAIRLCELASLFIKHEHDADLTDKIYSQLPKQSIVSSVEMIQTLTRKHHDKYYQELVEQYKTVRRFLPHLLKSITFESTQAGKPIKEIMNFLLAAEQRRKTNFNDAPKTIITPGWRDVVYKEDADTVDRAGYTLCAVDSLQTYLRSRDLYVPESKNWSDPRAKLISGEEWRQQGHLVCKSLNLSLDPEKMLDVLAERLDVAYKSVAERLPENQYANIAKKSNGKYQLKLGRLKASDESENLTWLVETVSDLMPNVDLPELLLEVDRITKFTQAFPNVNNFNSQLENINVSLCAILMAEGCNIELSQVEKRGVAALKYSRLSWVEQNCVDAENLLNGNAILVDYHTNHPMAKKMGTGHIVSGDGLRFTVAVDSVYSAPNKKYFPQGKRGVTYYGLTNDQCASLHGLVITGTLRDSLFLLDSLQEQKTIIEPEEIMTDTAGTSETVFALFWLLGYQFSPRLADIGKLYFWRIESEADYGDFNYISNHKIDLNIIKKHWEDILRIAVSLKLGYVSASELIRSLYRKNRPSGLAKALINLGRIVKTIFMLRYIDDEAYRRHILMQLNKGESRHGLARSVYHGKRGEIHEKYREGQEDSLSALTLVTNAIVLWNTIYIGKAVDHLKSQGFDIKPEDEARLSPLIRSHINFLGNFNFTLSKAVENGELRPLNNIKKDFKS